MGKMLVSTGTLKKINKDWKSGFSGRRSDIYMTKITIDFGNLIEEMKNKQVKLCLLHRRTGWFIIDNQNQLYQIETYYDGSFLDKFIIEKLHIDFILVPISISDSIREWEKDIWDITEVKKFIERQHLNCK